MSLHDRLLKPGTLKQSVMECTARALSRGAIQSLRTTSQTIPQRGVAFEVRLTAALADKEASTHGQATAGTNPFLPYDPDLFVGDLSPTHVALLNKFNVLDYHLLIVTRCFEEQQAFLTQRDCEALLLGLSEIDGLVFYNGGPAAGASQRHKHLQLIPLSDSAGARLPIEPLLRSAKILGDIGCLPGLPFRHGYGLMEPEWLDPRKDAAASFLARYRTLLRTAGISVEADAAPPYNLLATRQWLMIVPRRQECFEDISVNALGFAGTLLVKTAGQLSALRERGPMTALQHVALPLTVIPAALKKEHRTCE